jgi:epoxyqueuosine reductase
VPELEESIRREALDLGFARAGIAALAPLPHLPFFRRWLERGLGGGMDYLARDPELRGHPARLLPGARSAVVVAASYASPTPEPAPEPGQLLVARYARGQDYHRVLRQRLERLARRIEVLCGRPLSRRALVDTGPLLERELAMAAGLGFIGHNTLLITPGAGSYLLLGTLLLDLPLQPDAPVSAARCGSCRLCLRACPTGALLEPRLLDARRCISYLTIEHRDAIASPLRERLDPWIFGCDACQVACPYNHRRAAARFPALPELGGGEGRLELTALLGLGSGAYRRLVRGRALSRASRPMLQRNAALAAADPRHRALPAVREALAQATRHPHALVREAACWARSRP